MDFSMGSAANWVLPPEQAMPETLVLARAATDEATGLRLDQTARGRDLRRADDTSHRLVAHAELGGEEAKAAGRSQGADGGPLIARQLPWTLP